MKPYIAITIESHGFGYFPFEFQSFALLEKQLTEEFYDCDRASPKRLIQNLRSKKFKKDWAYSFFTSDDTITFRQALLRDQFFLSYDREAASNKTIALFIANLQNQITQQLELLTGKVATSGYCFYQQIALPDSTLFYHSTPKKNCCNIYRKNQFLNGFGFGVELLNPETGAGWLTYGDFVLAYLKGHLGEVIKNPFSLLTISDSAVRQFVKDHFLKN